MQQTAALQVIRTSEATASSKRSWFARCRAQELGNFRRLAPAMLQRSSQTAGNRRCRRRRPASTASIRRCVERLCALGTEIDGEVMTSLTARPLLPRYDSAVAATALSAVVTAALAVKLMRCRRSARPSPHYGAKPAGQSYHETALAGGAGCAGLPAPAPERPSVRESM